MDIEGFIRWALDDARNVEERYMVLLLVEQGLSWWNSRHNIYHHETIDEMIERKRQRALNPAYEPHYTEQDLRRAAEMFPKFKSWSHYCSHDERPIRDIKAIRFLPNLEDFRLSNVEVTDIGVLAELPRLRVLHFGSAKCEDLRPIADCAHLRELCSSFGVHWPEVSGLEKLEQLESLTLAGNLLALPRGLVWPRVRRGELSCSPLAMRCVRDLPRFPACEFLKLGGVERLDGI